jgi:UDP-glucose 4-epimerase
VALGSNDTKIDFYENLVTTYNLLEAMRKSPDCKKPIFASTSTVYGEAELLPTPENKHGVVFDLAKKLLSTHAYIEVLGNGMQRKSYMHIDDCIDALLRVLEIQSDVGFDVYNIGTDDAITVLDIARLLFQKFSTEPQKINFNDTHEGRGWNGDVREFLLDSSKIKRLGWSANIIAPKP